MTLSRPSVRTVKFVITVELVADTKLTFFCSNYDSLLHIFHDISHVQFFSIKPLQHTTCTADGRTKLPAFTHSGENVADKRR